MTLPPTKIYSTDLYDAAINVRHAEGQAELSATMKALYDVMEANIAAAVAAERERIKTACAAYAADYESTDSEAIAAAEIARRISD